MWMANFIFLKMILSTDCQERTQINDSTMDTPGFNHPINLRCTSDHLPLPQDSPTQDIRTIILKPVPTNSKVQFPNNMTHQKTIPCYTNHPKKNLLYVSNRFSLLQAKTNEDLSDKNTRQFPPLVIKILRKNKRTQVVCYKLTIPKKTRHWRRTTYNE